MSRKSSKSYVQALKTTLNQKARALGGVGLTEWLKSEASAREERRSSGIIESRASYLDALTTRGTNAEKMLKSGLYGSGYARYLDTRAKKTHERELAELDSEYNRAIADDLGDYEEHIATLKKEKDELYSRTMTELTASGVVNYEDALRAATDAGLDKRTAELLARRATTKTRFRLRSKVLNQIISEHLSSSGARSYAESLGLSAEDARELGSYAYKINQKRLDTGIIPIVFIDTIKEYENNKRIQEEKLNEKY